MVFNTASVSSLLSQKDGIYLVITRTFFEILFLSYEYHSSIFPRFLY